MTNRLDWLLDAGLIELPEELLAHDLGAREVAVYTIIEREGPIIPARIAEQYDISPGSLYPSIERLEARGLAKRRPVLGARGDTMEAVATGPEMGEHVRDDPQF